MQLELLKHYTPQQQTDINLVRIYLQTITLSDLSAPDGKDICGYHLRGERRPQQRIRHTTWPRQETPSASQKRLWRKYISSQYLRYSTKWKAQLGPVEFHRTPPIPYLPLAPGSDTSLAEYISQLPPWYRRLLFQFEQMADDVAVWRAFRAKRRLIIASDGSLTETAGTFGWKLTTSKHTPLFEGSGPVDGPIEIGSSTRSELGGFTAPLLLVTVLARFWGLKHRCKFRWIVDSKVAINRVVLVTRHDNSPNKQPNNCDYLSLIQELFKELRRPLSSEWIKGHQDDKKSYDQLSSDAKLNVDTDRLAISIHKNPRAKPMRDMAHLPATKISIQILSTRFYGNFEDNVRHHVNAGYMKAYLQARNNWSEQVWRTIDMTSFGKHFKTITQKLRPAHLKYVHDQLPLGNRKYTQGKIKDPAIKLCPCCKETDEDPEHFTHCEQNSSRQEALQTLMKALLSDQHPSQLVFAACLEQYLQFPNEPVTIDLPTLPKFLVEPLQQAILEQTHIGWQAALKGFLSLAWLRMASINQLNHDKLDHKAGRHRIHKALNALQDFARAIWLGRNDALHQDKETSDSQVYSAESAEIRHYHSNPTLLPASDGHYCDNVTLNRLLQSRPSVRRRWLRRVRQARANFLRDGDLQKNITTYLTPTTPRHNTHTVRTLPVTTTAHQRTTTTQQRMTSFFPGRPPDLQNQLPRNPSLSN